MRAPSVGQIGPNAVIQLGAALCAAPDARAAAERIYARAGFAALLHDPPMSMIDETIPARLFDALWTELSANRAAAIARDAGHRTGEYVLRNRIPALARAVLAALPAPIAARLLLKAIHRNAWTFAGSGICRVESGTPCVLTIERNPLKMPGCVWHVGVLERLFQALARPECRVRHCDDASNAATVCRFEIDVSNGRSGGRKAEFFQGESGAAGWGTGIK
jgi:divinyl protochlorophyllide a 8-vinyl-reductase